jgi:hypothetical protein
VERTRRIGYGLVVAIYLLSFPWHPGLRSPNELSRLMQTRALVDFGELSLNRAMRVYGGVGDLSLVSGRYFPSKAPLMSFAAVPVYAVLRSLAGGRPGSVPEIPLVFSSRLFLTVLPTLLSLILIERLLRHYVPPRTATAVTWVYALGTLAFSYSLLFMSHQTTATLLLAGFYVGWTVVLGRHAATWLLAVGFLLGLSVVAEYTSALPAFAVGTYAVLAGAITARDRVRNAALLVAGASPAILFLGWYHLTCFGGVLETGYRHLADVAYQPWHQGGFLGIKTPTWGAFAGSFFSPLRGLFALSPFLVLGVVGIPWMWKSRDRQRELGPLTVFTGLLFLGYLYFTSSFSYASWGWTTGPRHLTGLVPFLLVPAALQLEASRGWVRGVAVGLAASAIAVTAALTFVNYIPDDVSEGIFGLFIPLAREGRVVPTLLSFGASWGWASGWLVILAAGIVMCLVGAWLLDTSQATPAIVAFTVLLGVLLTHRAAYRDTEQDRGARSLLRAVWLSAPGETVSFWSTSGRVTSQ